MLNDCVAPLSCKSLKQIIMKRFIQTTLFFAVLATIAIYSNTISTFIVENYNNCFAYLAKNSIETVYALNH